MVVEKFDIADPLRTQLILKENHLRPQKSLGQNFLCTPQVLNQIIASAQLTATDIVLEIGPGIGGLTQQLAKSAAQVFAFEIDQRLLPILKTNLANYPNITLLNLDFLKLDLQQFWQQNRLTDRRVKVVANLPYYITTPILLKLLAAPVPLQQLVLMMQKEVAERLIAQPGHRAYGALSVLVQLRSQVTLTHEVAPQAFIPQPRVDSAIVSFDILKQPRYPIADDHQFQKFVQAVFRQKRKTLWNNLLKYVGAGSKQKQLLEQVFQSCHLEHNIRAEQLSLAALVQLNNQINQYFKL